MKTTTTTTTTNQPTNQPNKQTNKQTNKKNKQTNNYMKMQLELGQFNSIHTLLIFRKCKYIWIELHQYGHVTVFTSWGLVNVVDTLKPVIIYNGGGGRTCILFKDHLTTPVIISYISLILVWCSLMYRFLLSAVFARQVVVHCPRSPDHYESGPKLSESSVCSLLVRLLMYGLLRICSCIDFSVI